MLFLSGSVFPCCFTCAAGWPGAGGAGRCGIAEGPCEGRGLGLALGWGVGNGEFGLRETGIPGASLMGVALPEGPAEPLGLGLTRGNGFGGAGR